MVQPYGYTHPSTDRYYIIYVCI